MKFCTKCGLCKPFDQFHNCASKPSGKMSACKECRNTYNKKKSAEIGHDVLYRRAISKNPSDYSEKRQKYYQENADRIKQKSAEWKRQNAQRVKKLRKIHYHANKEQYKKNALKWACLNRASRRSSVSNYSKKLRANPESKPLLMARRLISRMLDLKLATRGKRTFLKLGYNKDQFVKHIEFQFLPGMTWENHGEWHLDHIISIKEFMSLGVKNVKIINALSNLRPIWAKDNLSKGKGFALASPVAL